MRQSLSERQQAEDFSAPLCFTRQSNGALIQSGMSPRHIRRAFPISFSQNTRRLVGRDRQNELNTDFPSVSLLFFPFPFSSQLLFFLLFRRESNHELFPVPISVLQLERCDDGRGTLAPDPHLPLKTGGKNDWKKN